MYVLLFLVTRLLLITTFPIFNDEAIVLHNGQVFLTLPREVWTLAGDGRGPLVTIFAGLLQLIPFSPILVARLAYMGISLVTFLVTVAISKRLGFNNWTQKVLALLLITSPYLFFFDPLVLPNGPVTMLSVIALYLTIAIIEKPTVAKGVLLGIIFGIGWWYFSLLAIIVPGLLGIIIFSADVKRKWRKIVATLVVAGAIFIGIIIPLELNPAYQNILAESPKRLLTIQEALQLPLAFWLSNFVKVFTWYLGYVTPFVVFFAAKNKKLRGLVVYTMVPILLTIILVKTTGARNQMVVMPPMYLLAAAGIASLREKWRLPISVVVIGTSALLSLLLLLKPYTFHRYLSVFPAAGADFSQYIMGWPSGWGVRDASDWLINASRKEQIIVLLLFHTGNPEDGIFTYLYKKNIPIRYILPRQTFDDAKTLFTKDPQATYYFVSRGSEFGPLVAHIDEVARFVKPFDPDYVGIYKVTLQ